MKKDVYEVTSGTFLTKSGETIKIKEGKYFLVKGLEKYPTHEHEYGYDYGPFDLEDIQYGLKTICEENEQNSEC